MDAKSIAYLSSRIGKFLAPVPTLFLTFNKINLNLTHAMPIWVHIVTRDPNFSRIFNCGNKVSNMFLLQFYAGLGLFYICDAFFLTGPFKISRFDFNLILDRSRVFQLSSFAD